MEKEALAGKIQDGETTEVLPVKESSAHPINKVIHITIRKRKNMLPRTFHMQVMISTTSILAYLHFQ